MSGFRFFAFGVAAILAIWAAVGYGGNKAVENAMFRESVDKATHWASYMAERIPELEALTETGVPNEEQRIIMSEAKLLGDVFRFKLFTADGRLSLVSDDVTMETYAGTSDVMDPEPKQVAETGMAIVDVFDGTNKSNRPDLYAEAYVPVIGKDGRVLAIVEVYIDQTATKVYFKESFHNYGLMLMLFCTAIFAIPSVAFYRQSKQTESSRSDAEFFARFDPLTGLMNRREFAIQAEKTLESNDLNYACYLDLDHFKTINDTHGHAIGDAFLAHTATIFRENCRKEDLIARFGGDEFVIGFRSISADQAVKRVRAILQMCPEKLTLATSVSLALSVLVLQKSNGTKTWRQSSKTQTLRCIMPRRLVGTTLQFTVTRWGRN